jgi:Neuraminidase-like domain
MFWPIFVEKPDMDMTRAYLPEGLDPLSQWEIKMAWSEYRQGRWTPKQASSGAITSTTLAYPASSEDQFSTSTTGETSRAGSFYFPKRQEHYFHASPEDERLSIVCNRRYDAQADFKFEENPVGSGVEITKPGVFGLFKERHERVGEIRFIGCRGRAEIDDADFPLEEGFDSLREPEDTFNVEMVFQSLIQVDGLTLRGDNKTEVLRQYDTISDVVLHLKYTARDGGGVLRTAATDALIELITESENVPLARLFSARHEFVSEWHRFLKPLESQSNHILKLELTRERFPFPVRNRSLTLKEMELFLKFKGEVIHPDGPLLDVFVRSPETDATVETDSLPGGVFSSLPNQYAGLPHVSGITLDQDLFGNWQIEVKKSDVQALLPGLKQVVSNSNIADQPLTNLVDALEDIYVVCHYAIGELVK